VFITLAQFFSRFRAESYSKTPATFERRAADEGLAASLAFARRARLRVDEFFQLSQHSLEDGTQKAQKKKHLNRGRFFKLALLASIERIANV
jgi:hypothetical protein